MELTPDDLTMVPRPMTQMCALHTHVIQKTPSGMYVCVYECGLVVREHHELVLGVGAGATLERPHGPQ